MKNNILLIIAGVLIISCGEQNKKPKTEAVPDKPLSRQEQMDKIVAKEKAEAVVMAKKPNNTGKGNANKVTSGFVNGGLTPIMGNASVSHGLTEDTLDLEVLHWGFQRLAPTIEAIWLNVSILHTDVNAPYPGKFVFDEMNEFTPLKPNPVPGKWRKIWPHDGLAVSYYFAVSSDGGWNWAGKTIPNN